MGRHREYRTAAALEKAIAGYFERIQTLEDTGHEDLRGCPIMRRVFVIPPTLGGLCAHLGITRDTWSRYASPDHEYHSVCAAAKAVIEQWLEEQLITREKSVDGIKFNLTHNYGWGGEKRELELGGDTRRALGAYGMTMADKLAALAEAQDLMAEYYQPPDEEDDAGTSEDDGADAM